MNDEPSNPPTPREQPNALWLAGLLALLVFAVYLPSFRGGFVWDDLLLVNENPLVKGEFTVRSIWFSTDFPLSNVALWLEWLAFGKDAAGYRIVNAVLHALSCVLLWRLLARLRIPGAWLGAALFVVHPVAVGSVAWISEIKNTLSLPFYLLSFGWFLDFEEHHGTGAEGKARIRYALSLVAFGLALLAKTSTVMLPVVLLLCAWWRRGRIARGDVFKTMPHFALALAFGLMTVWFQTQQTLATFSLPPESFAAKLAGAGRAVWFYLGKALLPLNLSAIYPRWEIDPRHALVYVPLGLLIVAAAVCWWWRRSWGRHGLFVLGCFTASLFPLLGFFDMYFLVFARVSDHFQYLALIVPLAGVAGLLGSVVGKNAFRTVGVMLIAALGMLAAQRTETYRTDEALWRDTLAKTPTAWNAHNNLGCILAEQNDLTGAMEHFTASLQLNPRNASAHCNLGKAQLLKNDFPEAEAHFRAALEIKPDHGETLKQYGVALANQQRWPEAVSLLRRSLRAKPEAETRRQLAPVLSSLGRDAEAVAELQLALVAEPDSVVGLKNLAWLLATSADEKVRDGRKSLLLAQRACELTEQKDGMTLAALAAAHAETGEFAEAVNTTLRAIEIAQSSADARMIQMYSQLLRPTRATAPPLLVLFRGDHWRLVEPMPLQFSVALMPPVRLLKCADRTFSEVALPKANGWPHSRPAVA